MHFIFLSLYLRYHLVEVYAQVQLPVRLSHVAIQHPGADIEELAESTDLGNIGQRAVEASDVLLSLRIHDDGLRHDELPLVLVHHVRLITALRLIIHPIEVDVLSFSLSRLTNVDDSLLAAPIPPMPVVDVDRIDLEHYLFEFKVRLSFL